MKQLITSLILFSSIYLKAQVYEKVAYSDSGDVVFRESVISSQHATTTFTSSGFYLFNQDQSGSYYRSVLYNRNLSGTSNFVKSYAALDSLGGILNAKSYAVEEDSVSGFISIGNVFDNDTNTVPGNSDILLARYNSNGVVSAAIRIDFGYEETGYDIVAKDSSHNRFYICGTVKKTSGNADVFVAEIDNNLNIIWIRRVDLRISSANTAFSELYSLTVDTNGNIFCAGSIRPGKNLNTDYLLLKFNNAGTFQYAERFFLSTEREVLYDITTGINGSLYITGSSVSTGITPMTKLFVAIYNPSSRALSQTKFLRTPEGSNYKNNTGFEIIETTVTGQPRQYYVVGSSRSVNDGLIDGLIYNLDASFSAKWQVLFESTDDVELYDAEFVTESGTGYLNHSGYFKDSLSFAAGYDIKTNMLGFSGCSDTISVDTFAVTMSIDTLLDSISISYSSYSITMDDFGLEDSLLCDTTSQFRVMNTNDIFMENEPLTIYPNPATGNQMVRINSKELITEIRVYSITGILLYSKKCPDQSDALIQLNNFTPGIYIVEIYGDQGRNEQKRKLVIK